MEEEFLTKAEINRAWNRKKKLDAVGDEGSVVRAEEQSHPSPPLLKYCRERMKSM
jgi:hypothetical protein